MPPSIGNSGRVTLTGLQVAADASDAAEARAALSAAVEVIEVPLDDSWMRDNGPIFALDGSGCRAGIHFGFNAWGGKFEGWERDEAAGGMLATRYGDIVFRAPLVLEGGSFSIDGAGRVVTTEQCLLHPNRNPESVLRCASLGPRCSWSVLSNCCCCDHSWPWSLNRPPPYFLVPAAATTVTGLICVGSGQSRPARHLFAPGGERSLSAQLPPSVQLRPSVNCPHPYNAGGK